MNLKDIMGMIDRGYAFTSDVYPEMPVPGSPGWMRFGIQHSLLHLMKSDGAIAASLEMADHGNNLSVEVIQAAALKQVVNALKLCAHLDVTAEEVEAHIVRTYGQRSED